jgi:acetyl esterase/lipase
MREYEITFRSLNSENYAKPITALVYEPESLSSQTGAVLFSHGWGGNRFQHADKMAHAVDLHDLICVSVEYRMSGYDFDPVTGLGSYRPYDASFLQTVDVLNGLREVLRHYDGVDRRRIYHYGGSQGGHIALLSAIYAPRTFGAVYATSPLTHISETIHEWTGRDLSSTELVVRDVPALAPAIACPVYLEHGTADETVDCDAHTRALEERLVALGKRVDVRYYPGGGHGLEPVTTRLETFSERIGTVLEESRDAEIGDFEAESTVRIPCGERNLVVDWSREADEVDLLRWEYEDRATCQ